MIHETPMEKAIALLEMHGGSCSVPHSSPLHREFYKLKLAGRVQVVSSGTPGFIDVMTPEFLARTKKPPENP